MNDEKGMRGMRRSTKRGSREKGRCGLARANGEGRTGIAYLRNEYGGRTVCLLPYSPSFQREKSLSALLSTLGSSHSIDLWPCSPGRNGQA